MTIFSSMAVIIFGAVFAVGGFWLLRGHAAPVASVAPEDMTPGERVLAWGVCAAPLGLVFLIGDYRVETDWLQVMALALLALGLA